MKKIGHKATAVALALGIAVAGISPASAASVNLAGGGATFQADFQAKCLAKFNADNTANKIGNDNLKISYAGVGSGGGRTGLGNNTYAFAGSDSLGTASGLTKDNSIWFPVVAAPLAILINLKSSTGSKITSLRLDTLTLSQILNGGIKTWNDSRIAALNTGVNLPSTAITVVSRSDSSGSTGNLKSYLYQNLTGAEKNKWSNGGQTQQDEFARGGIGMPGSPKLVEKVGDVNGAIGYADLSDVTTKVSVVTMKNVAGDWVKPTSTSAALYVKAADVLTPSAYSDAGTAPDQKSSINGGIYNVNFTKSVKGAYQLTFITYMVAKKGTNDNNYNTRVMKYANYVVTKCSVTPSSIGASGYVSVGSTLLGVAKTQIGKIDD